MNQIVEFNAAPADAAAEEEALAYYTPQSKRASAPAPDTAQDTTGQDALEQMFGYYAA